MEFLQKTAKAFLGGGIAAIITQGIFMLFQFVPVTPHAQTLLTLLSMGILGAILYLLHIYPRLEQQVGFGAMLPICGLPVALADSIVKHLENGETTKSALKKSVLPVVGVLLTGFCFSVIFAVIVSLF